MLVAKRANGSAFAYPEDVMAFADAEDVAQDAQDVCGFRRREQWAQDLPQPP